MTEYKIGPAIVRIHGEADAEDETISALLERRQAKHIHPQYEGRKRECQVRNVPKTYHDENYRDPPAIGYCDLCGEPIEAGEPYYETEGGMVHADGVYCRVSLAGRARDVSCLAAYLSGRYFDDDLAAALGMRKVGGTS